MLTAREALREERKQDRRNQRDRLSLARPRPRRRFFREPDGVRQAAGLVAIETGDYETIGDED